MADLKKTIKSGAVKLEGIVSTGEISQIVEAINTNADAIIRLENRLNELEEKLFRRIDI